MNTNKNAESMMLSSVIQLLAFNKMKANGIHFEISNRDHVFKDFYEDGVDMWAGQISYFILNTGENAETLEDKGIITRCEKLYFLDEDENEQEVDVDMESGFPLYYFNGYPLDTDEFEIMHKYRISDTIVNRAKEIIESLTVHSKLDILFNVVNEENTKFFIPIFVATLYNTLRSIEEKSDITEDFAENTLLSAQKDPNESLEQYVSNALQKVYNVDTVTAFSVRNEQQGAPSDWKETISFN